MSQKSVSHLPNWINLGRPRSFAGLMNLWEDNFRSLQQLLPELDLRVDFAKSLSQSDAPLYLEILERNPYTLTLMLTYRDAQHVEFPKLRVRIYRDAGVAQAMDAMPAAFGENLDRQWERNLLLNKWLDFCLTHGHGFSLADCAV
jgi:uncharacterized protein YqiB (DUF1249 family)